MKHEAPPEAVAAARAYEELHVPAIFRQWAPQVVDAAAVQPGHRVLDVGCGTGVVARAALDRVGSAGTVVGIDPSPGMLVVAEQLAPKVEWREGVAEALPFEGEVFDRVLSQFGLMFFPDRLRALREMYRVLAPGGRLAVAVFESLEKTEAYPLEVDLLERLAGTPAGDALRAPFALGDKAALEELFRDAGIAPVAIETRGGPVRFPSIRRMVEADLRGWLPVMGVHLGEDEIQRILAEAEDVLSGYVTEDGAIAFDSPAHIVVGHKPD